MRNAVPVSLMLAVCAGCYASHTLPEDADWDRAPSCLPPIPEGTEAIDVYAGLGPMHDGVDHQSGVSLNAQRLDLQVLLEHMGDSDVSALARHLDVAAVTRAEADIAGCESAWSGALRVLYDSGADGAPDSALELPWLAPSLIPSLGVEDRWSHRVLARHGTGHVSEMALRPLLVGEARDWGPPLPSLDTPQLETLGDRLIRDLSAGACAARAGEPRRSVAGEDVPFWVDDTGIDHRAMLHELVEGAAYARGTTLLATSSFEPVLLEEWMSGLEREFPATLWDQAFGALGASRFDGIRSAEDALANRGVEPRGRFSGVPLEVGRDPFVLPHTTLTWGDARHAAEADASACHDSWLLRHVFSAALRGRLHMLVRGFGDPETEVHLQQARTCWLDSWETVRAVSAVRTAGSLIEMLDWHRDADARYSVAEHARLWTTLRMRVQTLSLNPAGLYFDAALHRARLQHVGTQPALRPADRAARRAALVALREQLMQDRGLDARELEGGDECGW